LEAHRHRFAAGSAPPMPQARFAWLLRAAFST
jgi:hypothetical protein